MPASNDPRYVMFKGDHPYFEDGERYTYSQYSRWTEDNCEDGGVKLSTMKGRLSKLHHCEKHHLLSPKKFMLRNDRVINAKGFHHAARRNVLTQSRLTAEEAFSQKWLIKKW